MISKTMATFIAKFESELKSANDVEKAIEIACSFDTQNLDDYDL